MIVVVACRMVEYNRDTIDRFIVVCSCIIIDGALCYYYQSANRKFEMGTKKSVWYTGTYNQEDLNLSDITHSASLYAVMLSIIVTVVFTLDS